MDRFYIAQNDTLPELMVQVDPPYDLTGATAVFSMRDRATGALKVNRAAATIANGSYTVDGVSVSYTPADGVLIHSWQAAETDTAGVYEAEFEVTFPSGDVLTAPNSAKIVVEITDDIG